MRIVKDICVMKDLPKERSEASQRISWINRPIKLHNLKRQSLHISLPTTEIVGGPEGCPVNSDDETVGAHHTSE